MLWGVQLLCTFGTVTDRHSPKLYMSLCLLLAIAVCCGLLCYLWAVYVHVWVPAVCIYVVGRPGQVSTAL